jgi:hypothetical protein
MTSTSPAPRVGTIAERIHPYLLFALAGLGTVWGLFWLPAWFLVAQLIRQWAPRGGMRWLASRGVPEYTDEMYALYMGNIPLALIGVRLLLSVDILEPFKMLNDKRLDTTSGAETTVFLGIVVGCVIATALTGVLRTHGWPWLLSAAGFTALMVWAIGSFGLIWHSNALYAMPFIPLAWLSSAIPMFICRRLDRRPTADSDAPAEDFTWTEDQES